MEAATLEQVTEQAQVEEPVAVTATGKRMFRHSQFIDVGEGALECEHKRDGECADPEHFHAWCRLPNPYQHEDMRNKGLAAKARAIRALKDPEADVTVVLDAELATINDESYKDTIIDELLSREWTEDYLKAQEDVEAEDDFEHITQDREEWGRVDKANTDIPEEERSEEYKRLRSHMEKYLARIGTRLDEIQKPKREEFGDRSMESIMDLVRSKRIEELGGAAFANSFSAWQIFVGTYKVDLHPTLGRPHAPRWEDIGVRDRPAPGTMYGEAPEVIDALQRLYNNLSLSLQAGSAGN